jgi:hypothetical protein
MRQAGLVGIFAIATSCLMLGPTVVQAGNARVERAFRGKVVVMKKRPPARFRSQGAFIRFLRSHRVKHLWPDKDNKEQWTFEFMAFFKRKLDDIEVKIKFYDITEGKKFVAADAFFTRARGEKILASKMVLEKPRFNINRKYLMQVTTARNRPLARTVFWLRGRKERYSGKVEFSDDEARLDK